MKGNRIIAMFAILTVCSLQLTVAQTFSLVPVDTAKTSQNTVTCIEHRTDSGNFIYSAGDGPLIDVFSMNEEGQLKHEISYTGSGGKRTIRGLVIDEVGGNEFLFAGLKGAHAVEVFRINSDGTLESTFVVHDTDSTYLNTVITLQVIHMAKSSYLFVGGLEMAAGLSSFKINPDGSLEHIQSMADNDQIFTDGIIGMSLHRLNDKTFLFAGGFQDNGLSCFEVMENGHFENRSNVADDDRKFLNGTYPVISIEKSGWPFVIVGHRNHIYYKPTKWIKDKDSYYYHGDAVSVFLVDETGQLVPRSVFQGNSETLIKGQTRLQHIHYNDQYDLVAVATRDDQSIQLCLLKETGLLVDAGKIKTGFPIYYGLTDQIVENRHYLVAGSVTGNEIVSYRLEIQE